MSDRTVMHAADLSGFGQIYPALRRFAAVVADADMDPDDLVQEALARALRTGSFQDLSDPLAYLRQAVLNLRSNERRRRARARSHRTGLGLPATQDETYPSDLTDLLQLQPRDRAVLYLHEVEDMTYQAIAELMDEKEATVRGRATAARRRLRRGLEEET